MLTFMEVILKSFQRDLNPNKTSISAKALIKNVIIKWIEFSNHENLPEISFDVFLASMVLICHAPLNFSSVKIKLETWIFPDLLLN